MYQNADASWSVSLYLVKGTYYYYYLINDCEQFVDHQNPVCDVSINNISRKMNFIQIMNVLDKYTVTHISLPIDQIQHICIQTYTLIYSRMIETLNQAHELDQWLGRQPVTHRLVIADSKWKQHMSNAMILSDEPYDLVTLFTVYGLVTDHPAICDKYTVVVSNTDLTQDIVTMLQKYPPKHLFTDNELPALGEIHIHRQKYGFYDVL
jgi:hypothetical protein